MFSSMKTFGSSDEGSSLSERRHDITVVKTSARDEVQPAFVTRNVFGNEDSGSLKVYESGRHRISSLRKGEENPADAFVKMLWRGQVGAAERGVRKHVLFVETSLLYLTVLKLLEKKSGVRLKSWRRVLSKVPRKLGLL